MEESAGTECSELSGQADSILSLIFPALYNGPINYYARLVRQKEIVLEQHDSYTKQTYRNRCLIMGPNGVITLSIPVKKKRGVKNLLRDIRDRLRYELEQDPLAQPGGFLCLLSLL